MTILSSQQAVEFARRIADAEVHNPDSDLALLSRIYKTADDLAEHRRVEIEQLRNTLALEGQYRAGAVAEATRLRYALARLSNEVRATMSLAEASVREAAGNTNYQCLMDAESEARVALGDQQAGTDSK